MFSFLETTLFVFSTLFGVYILLGVLLISIYNKAIISSFFPYCNSFRIFFIIPPRKPEKYRMTQQFYCQAKPVSTVIPYVFQRKWERKNTMSN